MNFVNNNINSQNNMAGINNFVPPMNQMNQMNLMNQKSNEYESKFFIYDELPTNMAKYATISETIRY